MLRFLARALGSVLLAVAVIYAVGDIARTLADDVVTLTSLDGALAGLGVGAPAPVPADGAAAGEGAAPLGIGARWYAAVMSALGPLPAAAVFLAAALVLLLLGQPRRERERLRAVRDR